MRIAARLVLLSIAALALAATTAVPSFAQARKLEGGYPSRLNNHGDVVGSESEVLVLWKANGARTELTPNWRSLHRPAINDDGTIIGEVDMHADGSDHGTRIALWRNGNGSIVHALEPGGWRVHTIWLGRGTDWGASYATPDGHRIKFGGVERAAGRRVRVHGGAGGAFVHAGEPGGVDFVYVDPYAKITAPVPAGRYPMAVAEDGVLLTRDGGGGVDAVLDAPLSLQRWNPATSKFSETRLPVLPVVGMLGVNKGGRVVGVRDGQVWTLRPGGAWEDITAFLGIPADARTLTARDVNDWGDILIAFRTGGPGDAAVSHGIVWAPRVALTGQISSTATASGRSAAKRVRLTGGPVELSAVANRAGSFTIQVPAGATDALTLQAPNGSCLRTASGCTSSAVLPAVRANQKPIRLATAKVTPPAAFVARVDSALAVRKGRASTRVRCSAAAACVATVTLRSGRTVLGTGRVTVARGSTKVVSIALNRAGARLVAARGTKPVRAQLSVRIGRSTTTLVRAFRL